LVFTDVRANEFHADCADGGAISDGVPGAPRQRPRVDAIRDDDSAQPQIVLGDGVRHAVPLLLNRQSRVAQRLLN